MHKEIPVKVTASIDEGVAPLVIALNEHPCIRTMDSCQDRGGGVASVYFQIAGCDPWEFHQTFAGIVFHPSQCFLSLHLEFFGGLSQNPTAEIRTTCVEGAAQEVSVAIHKMLNAKPLSP